MANGSATTKEVYESLNEFKDKTGENMSDIKETLATIVANQENRKEADKDTKNKLEAQGEAIHDLDKRVSKNTWILGGAMALTFPIVTGVIIMLIKFEMLG